MRDTVHRECWRYLLDHYRSFVVFQHFKNAALGHIQQFIAAPAILAYPSSAISFATEIISRTTARHERYPHKHKYLPRWACSLTFRKVRKTTGAF